jgi:CRP-like cAMP-binding protein
MLATTQEIDPRSGIAMSYPATGRMPRVSPAVIGTSFLGPHEPRATIVTANRDEEIVAQDDDATHCYLIVSGCVRTVRLMEDGRRQIGEFLFAGDLFGWEALDTHDFGAEAVTPVTLRRYTRRDLEQLVDQDRDVARQLREIASRRLRAGREHMVLLGRKAACERIASFLLEMAARTANGEQVIELPMNRGDISDYLGLTIETVCRRLTRLRLDGTIGVEGAKIAICNRHALGLAGSDRVVH